MEGDLPQAVNVSEVKSVLREVYKKRGYLVLGQPVRVKSVYAVGQTVTQVFNYDFGTEFEVTEATDEQDFKAQNDLIAELRPAWTRLEPEAGLRFFRIKPAMRTETAKVG